MNSEDKLLDNQFGILLCTAKNQALVEYALADNKNKLFVSKYKLKLPAEEELQLLVEEELKKR